VLCFLKGRHFSCNVAPVDIVVTASCCSSPVRPVLSAQSTPLLLVIVFCCYTSDQFVLSGVVAMGSELPKIGSMLVQCAERAMSRNEPP
jgi:hypothetical protein